MSDELIDVAWKVIEQFIKEWQVEPHYWLNEIDVQVEVASRLSHAYRLMGQDRVSGWLEQKSYWKRGNKPQPRFSRVVCEPYKRTNKSKASYNHPDIIIWADEARDNVAINSGHFPILMACEIKYKDNGSGKEGDDDINRLKRMLESGSAEYGCFLDLIMEGDVRTACDAPSNLKILSVRPSKPW